MPQNNFIHLSGTLAEDPYFELLQGEKGKTPYIRFDLIVERDPGQPASSALAPSRGHEAAAKPSDGRRADLIRVSAYGLRARIDFFYLKKGAHVAISGCLQSRRYFDSGVKRMRRVTEVTAHTVSYGRGCDFERGERQRVSILKQLEEEREAVPLDLAGGPIVLGPEDTVVDLA